MISNESLVAKAATADPEALAGTAPTAGAGTVATAGAGAVPQGAATGPARWVRGVAARQGLVRWLVPAIPGIAELIVGGYRIGVPSLWRDEAATIAGSQRPVGAILALLTHQDVVHGPYYLLMHVVIAAGGTSPTVLRLPSLIAMCLAVALTAALGQRLAKSADLPAAATGLLAGLLLVALPLTTRYAQEARPYALTSLFAVLASYLLVIAVRKRRAAVWAGYAAAVVLTGMCSLFALLILIAHGISLAAARARGRVLAAATSPLAVAARERGTAGAAQLTAARGQVPAAAADLARALGAGPAAAADIARVQGAGLAAPAETTDRLARGSELRWLAAAGASVVLLSPMLILGAAQRSQLNWVTRPGLGSVASLAAGFAGAALLIPVAAALAVAGATAGHGLRPGRGITLAVVTLPWLLLPPVLLMAISQFKPVYVERYVIFCMPALSVLAAAGLTRLVAMARQAQRTVQARLGRRLPALTAALPAAALLALTAVVLAGPQIAVRTAGSRPDNLRAVAAAIAARERPGDAIVYLPWVASIIDKAYPSPFSRLDEVELGVSPVVSGTLRGLAVPAGELPGRLAAVRRVWAVQYAAQTPGSAWAPTDRAAAALVAKMALIGRWRIGSVILSLYRQHLPAA